MIKLSKTTSPQILFDYECVTLYHPSNLFSVCIPKDDKIVYSYCIGKIWKFMEYQQRSGCYNRQNWSLDPLVKLNFP